MSRPTTVHETVVRAGVAAVVRDGRGRVLLHRRRVGEGWAPPSGHLEPGESLREGVAREVREETALAVRVGVLVGVYSDPATQTVRYPDGRAVHFVTALFECRVAGGVLRGDGGEGTAWAWFEDGAWPSGLLPYAEVWLRDARDGARGVVR